MKRKMLVWFVAGIVIVSITAKNRNLVFASSCHGGGGGEKQHATEHTSKKNKMSKPVEIIEIKVPKKMNIKGTLTCPGDHLYSKKIGDWHDVKKCKSSAVFVKKIDGCDKSGTADCPYEQKLYHIIYSEKTKKLFKNKKLHDAGISIDGRLYPDEKVVEVLSYRMLDSKENKQMKSRQKSFSTTGEEVLRENKIYICPMHANITSRKPGNCILCGMNLEIGS